MDTDVSLLQEAAPPPEDVMRLREANLPPAEGIGARNLGSQRHGLVLFTFGACYWIGVTAFIVIGFEP